MMNSNQFFRFQALKIDKNLENFFRNFFLHKKSFFASFFQKVDDKTQVYTNFVDLNSTVRSLGG